MPDVSIITVTFNAEKYIAECLQSVASQRKVSIEHLIIDGGSQDRTVELASAFPHVSTILSEVDQGIYDAMNKGASLSTGRLLLFLNSDDRLASENALADALKEIDACDFHDIYYGSLLVERTNGDIVTHIPRPAEEAAEVLICGCLPHQSTLTRRKSWPKIGSFNLSYRFHSDYEWFLRAVEDPDVSIRRISTVIGCFREGGLSTQKFEEAQREIYAIQAESPLYQTPHWQAVRLKAFQEGFLQVRMENMSKKQSSSTPASDRSAGLPVLVARKGLLGIIATLRKLARRLRA
jgi:glycosyltransferase involved in cell wall biosynthesis